MATYGTATWSALERGHVMGRWVARVRWDRQTAPQRWYTWAKYTLAFDDEISRTPKNTLHSPKFPNRLPGIYLGPGSMHTRSSLALFSNGTFLICTFPTGCNLNPPAAPVTPPITSTTTPVPEKHTAWDVSTNVNAVTGIKTVVASAGYGDESMIIRQTGKKFDLYINTGTFLETIDNLNSRLVSVTYRIDDGKPVHQYWTLSDDNTALFYPGNPSQLIEKLRKAQTFHIEYPPADRVPEVISLDVSGCRMCS